jgi:hypothetical protein
LALLVGLMALSSAPGRRGVVFSAILATPFAFLEVFAVPEYWNPPRAHVWLGIGAEDLVYACAIGGISWLLATWPFRHRIVLNISPRRAAWRFLVFIVMGVPLNLGLVWLHVKPMFCILAPNLVAGLLLLRLRPAFWRAAVLGMAGYTVVHVACLKIAFALMPSFAASWNRGSLWGPKPWGIPLDEIVWSAAFGAVWPLFTAYVFDAVLLPDPLPPIRCAALR